MSSSSREPTHQPLTTEHRRPLYAFVAVFVVAMLVLVGAARSDAFRDLVRERSVDIVAGTALDLVGEPEPRLVVAAPEAAAPASPAPGSGQGRDKSGDPGKAKGHDKSGHPGKAKGHDRSGHPGKAKGHDRSGHPGKAKGHGKGKVKKGHPGKAHDKGSNKGKPGR